MTKENYLNGEIDTVEVCRGKMLGPKICLDMIRLFIKLKIIITYFLGIRMIYIVPLIADSSSKNYLANLN